MMRERPILFSGPMVRAILAGRKTQTRRVVRGPIDFVGGIGQRGDLSCWGWSIEDDYGDRWAVLARDLDERHSHGCVSIPCPYGSVGDRLWVKESWARRLDEDHLSPSQLSGHWAWYWADAQTCNTGCAGAAGRKRPSIHMPRWASRITLEITDVRVQRLQDIGELDAEAEGRHLDASEPLDYFPHTWDSINGKRAPWAGNPWVWAITFRVISATVGESRIVVH